MCRPVLNTFPTSAYECADLVWWQSVEDLERKFRNTCPEPGTVFWYPLGPGPDDNWAPVRVSSVGNGFAELDGNESISATGMVVEVSLLSLSKKT